MTDFEAQVLADLSVLKMQMKEMLGDGYPGRIGHIEARVFEHEKAVQRLRGMAGAFAAVFTVVQCTVDLFVGRR